MSGAYDSRILTLTAGIPMALPPARQYVVLSASVNTSALGISIGDGNGDFTAWPAGLAIKFDRSIPARLVSSVTQIVAIGFTDGGVSLVDSRNVPIGPTAATIIDGGDVALGSRADASATTDGGTFSLIALMKRLLGKVGPVTSVDGGLVSLGATTDAAATTDAGTFSLIALTKRMLGKIWPITATDGAIVSIGATTDAAATTDAGTFSLIALTKRLLGKNFGASVPTYQTVLGVASSTGSAFVVTTYITGASNINGIEIVTAVLSVANEVNATVALNDNTTDLAILLPGQAVAMSGFVIPATRPLRIGTAGKAYACVTYKLL